MTFHNNHGPIAIVDIDTADTLDARFGYADAVAVLLVGCADELAQAWLDCLDELAPYVYNYPPTLRCAA